MLYRYSVLDVQSIQPFLQVDVRSMQLVAKDQLPSTVDAAGESPNGILEEISIPNRAIASFIQQMNVLWCLAEIHLTRNFD